MLQTEQGHFEASRLMEHLTVLCEQIGARPPTSREERRAAEYVRQTLESLGVEDVSEQFFASAASLGSYFIPYLVVGSFAPLMRGSLGKLLGGAALLGTVKGLWDAERLKPPPYAAVAAQGVSQNVIARIPPSGEIRQRVYLLGHLDSQKQRFMAPTVLPELMKPFNTFAVLLTALTGVSMLLDVLAGRKKLGTLQLLSALVGFSALAGFLMDEQQPHVEGANDNASAVAVLLGIAGALKQQPLQHTEVNLLFTGCEEVGDVGIEAFLREHAPSKRDSYFIDLEMVGTGRLCYVTKHGVSYLSEYRPGAHITPMAARVARANPELRITGKDMLIVEEVSRLREHGYEAICIAGYDERGYLPNWHRLTDTLDKIEGDTLVRAARYTWLLMQEIDTAAS